MLCFTLYLRAIFQVQARGGAIFGGEGGFLRYRFGGAYIWRGLYMEGLTFGILQYFSLFSNCSIVSQIPINSQAKNSSIYVVIVRKWWRFYSRISLISNLFAMLLMLWCKVILGLSFYFPCIKLSTYNTILKNKEMK